LSKEQPKGSQHARNVL